ncbi:hypothetical protein GCM10017044_18490 [Kordiimonas sediminis]|uniref:Solute-binding protein family 3/N-terminal domain-containing protein n=1 Tax=Kordiimonas sediminis TaxID=1735581 RepID=A0A919AUC7_9PROT|nr:transporter substrate-binding domain-containing protein [Kordiimonas sediminis]GHF24176.1 hypothetical protein GCM10017044_18490 [Kordiimonas sediminis]
MIRSLGLEGLQFCITGYSYREERAKSGQYTLPIAQSSQSGVAIREGSDATFKPYHALIDLIKDRDHVGGFIAGANYGDGIAEILRANKEYHIQISGSDSDLLKLLASGRVDYVMVDGNQVAYANETGLYDTQFDVFYPTDLREPVPLHIICSKGVPEPTMQQLNSAIQNLGLPKE